MIRTTRPKVELLSRSFIEKIVDEAFLLLGRHGVFVENAEARSLFKEAGMPVDETNLRVLINRKLIEDSLASTPLTVKLYDRTGRKEFVVGHDNVHFDPGSAAVKILDHSTQQERKPETADLVRLARLTESCEHIHFQSTALVSSDVPEIIADSYRLYLGLQFSSKPVVTGTFRTEGFRPMFEMLAAVRGGDEELRRKPLAIFDACPSPPLKWSNLTTQSLIDCARAGIPSELISMGLTGATSPVTIAGTLVQHVAENLAGLVICQLAQHGAPVIFGGSPASFDMRKGTTPMGAIETMMIDMAYAQIGKYLKLPTHAYMGLSDAKIDDAQAGLESGMGATLAALAGINVISGAGMLNFESTQSLEKLLVDNEICGMAYRLIEGIAQREDPLALRLFEGFKPETQFMTMPHTRKWYRLEHTFPRLADRDTYDAWVSQGRKSMDDRAHDRVEQILDETPPNLADEALRKELERIMRRDAKNNGFDRLPDIL
ncbi:MAG: trimethylamine methyltransferase family protein [Candidatus Aminicenantes bacterium]|jgi:trimethylamine--corrinoid protein Co-methyltransferase|nr:trimethylamine methyltransferase family protein [Candidatus Aminicenantes bacterium]